MLLVKDMKTITVASVDLFIDDSRVPERFGVVFLPCLDRQQ